ncbi:MAG: MetS family NSS transporter small subunit [Victivallales bacterium]|nr:MetS family NSS transporter small subunit [Victivallales bacterium]
MSISAIIFMSLAIIFTWGGFIICAALAIKKRNI